MVATRFPRCFFVGVLLHMFAAPGPALTSDVFASVDHLHHLVEAEGYMKQALKDYIEDEEERLDIMEELLEPIALIHDRDEVKDTEKFIGHPLNAFHLIKRYITQWPQLFAALDDREHAQDLKHIASDFKAVLPQNSDYDGALLSLLRLQRVYGLSTQELSEGWLHHKRASPLGHEHMYDIGVAALNHLWDMDLAEEWMRTARNVERPPLANLNTVDEQYRSVRDQNKARKEKANTEEQLEEEKEPASYTKYKELCKKSIYKAYDNPAKDGLFCYTHTTNVPYYTHKVEVLYSDPEISLIHDFVTEREAQVVRDLAKRTMVRAKVGLDGEAKPSEVRVGKVAFLEDTKHAVISAIGKRSSHLTGLNTTYPTGEPLQVVNYGIGGHYDVHYDFDVNASRRRTPSDDEPVTDDIQRVAGDRMATLMIYLNDVELGGATVFPEIDLYVRPEARAALFWFNYDTAGEGVLGSLHAACPVLLGQKWVANKWIRQFGQELYRPCRIDEGIVYYRA